MSIALVPMLGLLLYYTPWGLDLTSTITNLFALTLFFAAVAIAREHQTKKKHETPSD
jgi:uncharacterized membrane protein